MRTHKDRQHTSYYALPEVKEALEDSATRISRAAPEQTREVGGRYWNTHHLDALVCWFLTKPQDVQDRIILEGRSIALRLAELGAPAKDFPAAYMAPSAPVAKRRRAPKKGNDVGYNDVGGATTIPEVITRHARKPRGGAGGKKKGPKAKGRPAVGIGE